MSVKIPCSKLKRLRFDLEDAQVDLKRDKLARKSFQYDLKNYKTIQLG